MGKANFTNEFKLDAIKQITERGYSVADVSRRLGVSTHGSVAKFSVRRDATYLWAHLSSECGGLPEW